MSWIVAQIGAREHYAIARALQQVGEVPHLITDLWNRPGSPWSRLPHLQRLTERWHPELAACAVDAPVASMLAFELWQKISRQTGWPLILARNHYFQKEALQILNQAPIPPPHPSDRPTTNNKYPITNNHLFTYSYAALHLLTWARERGMQTILGQIDPGPEEERVVKAECARYPELARDWQPAPADYWRDWHQETELADRIVVNSEWSKQALEKEGVDSAKIAIVPLYYAPPESPASSIPSDRPTNDRLNLLFLGQINLRKGIGRLLDAMRLLHDAPVHLDLVGPAQVPTTAWANLPNVSWHGPVARSEVARHYAAADLLILPTLSDGFAMTQLEALAYGVPLLVSRHCGEVVQPEVNGRILDDLEPATIATAIRRWLDEPILKPVAARNGPLSSLEALGRRLQEIAG